MENPFVEVLGSNNSPHNGVWYLNSTHNLVVTSLGSKSVAILLNPTLVVTHSSERNCEFLIEKLGLTGTWYVSSPIQIPLSGLYRLMNVCKEELDVYEKQDEEICPETYKKLTDKYLEVYSEYKPRLYYKDGVFVNFFETLTNVLYVSRRHIQDIVRELSDCNLIVTTFNKWYNDFVVTDTSFMFGNQGFHLMYINSNKGELVPLSEAITEHNISIRSMVYLYSQFNYTEDTKWVEGKNTVTKQNYSAMDIYCFNGKLHAYYSKEGSLRELNWVDNASAKNEIIKFCKVAMSTEEFDKITKVNRLDRTSIERLLLKNFAVERYQVDESLSRGTDMFLTYPLN